MALKFISSSYILFHHLPLRSLASAPGALAFFLDEECVQASIINPSVNLPVDTCLVTPGALGIAVKTLPPCTTGQATLVLYRDTSCANPLNSNLQYDNCYFDGPNGVPAVVFACKDVAGGGVATATSTVSAGSSSMPVAADIPTGTSSSSTAAQHTTPSSNGATSTSSAPSSSTSPNSTQTDTNSGGTGSGLSQKWQIILGVILPLGGIMVALLAWWFPRRNRGMHDEPDQYNLMHHSSQGLAHSTMGMSPSASSSLQPPNTNYGNFQRGPEFSTGQGHWGRPW